MSALVIWPIVGIVVVAGACFAHGYTNNPMARAKYVVLALLTFGSPALIYVFIWPLARQYPPFSLTYVLGFGLTMWVTAALYSIAVVLCKRDIAPSK
jgi:hypothetical protein